MCGLCPELPMPTLKEFTLALGWGRVQTALSIYGEVVSEPPVDTQIPCSSLLQVCLLYSQTPHHGYWGLTPLYGCFSHAYAHMSHLIVFCNLSHSSLASLGYNAKPLVKDREMPKEELTALSTIKSSLQIARKTCHWKIWCIWKLPLSTKHHLIWKIINFNRLFLFNF